MNYLDLTRDLAEMSGTVDPAVITSVSTATGRIGLMARSVQQAWTQIQTEYRGWRFLVSAIPDGARVLQNVGDVVPLDLTITDWSEWIPGDAAGAVPMTIWAEEDRSDEQPLAVERRYRRFRRNRRTGTEAVRTGRPQEISVDPFDNLALYPIPDRDYFIAGTYRRAPQRLILDTDTPIIAEEYHDLISWAGKMLMDHFDEVPGGVTLANIELPLGYQARMSAMRQRYLTGASARLVSDPIGGSGGAGGIGGLVGLGGPPPVA